MNKYGHDMTWEEWTEGFFAASDWQIDRTGISEEEAEIKYPNFYASYQNGDEPEDFYCQYFVSHERGEVEIWFDPDEPDDYDEELDAILSNTEFYLTFSSEISNLKVLNDIEIRNTKVFNTLKKQIFVGAITCLETYLTDAFINTVLSEKEYLKSFFLSFNIFKEQSIKMSVLFDTFDKAEEIAKEKMSEVLYHNIPKVKQMYKATLNISFPEIGKIAKYVSQRHDLIHRNGKNKKGNSVFINKIDVEKVISDIEAFVNTIDKQLKDKEKKQQLKTNNDDWDSIAF